MFGTRLGQLARSSIRIVTSAAATTASRGGGTTAPKMGRAKRGLFAGKTVRFGNHVSFSQRKTRRKWEPNVQRASAYSEILGRPVRGRMTTYALRCIDKAGGVDAYLLGMDPKKLANDPYAAKVRAVLLRKAARSLPANVTLADKLAAERALITKYL